MLNVLKRVEKLRRDVGGGKGDSLEPPKNLPDLARDMYERDQQKTSYANTSPQESTPSTSIPVATTITDTHNSFTSASFAQNSKVVNEPNKDSVPGLDLSLVRQHLAASQSAIQSIPSHQPLSSQSVQPPMQNPTQQPAQQFIHQPIVSQPILQSSQSVFLENSNTVDDSTGFFKEFEEYVRNNGLSNDIVSELLDKNLLDHMMFYHTTKGEDMPFYASSAELSHAIKVKLEDLQNLERTWISNKQKMDLMKKWSSAIESDIHLRSEELKKMMIESRKRGAAVNNVGNSIVNTSVKSTDFSNDFFQIVKPRVVESKVETNYSIVQEPVHVQTNNFVDNNINAPNSSRIISPISSFISHPSKSSKYLLNKYVTSDSSKYFYAFDGQVFKSLNDFMNGLEIMDKNTFNYHVNDSKNDFSNWIKGVFDDFRLSDSIRDIVDRESMWHFLKNNTY